MCLYKALVFDMFDVNKSFFHGTTPKENFLFSLPMYLFFHFHLKVHSLFLLEVGIVNTSVTAWQCAEISLEHSGIVDVTIAQVSTNHISVLM